MAFRCVFVDFFKLEYNSTNKDHSKHELYDLLGRVKDFKEAYKSHFKGDLADSGDVHLERRDLNPVKFAT
ncbi:hypothetical protein Gasu2_17660 [Galdieria sulphuraria]|uniref:Uncharacterized protein n=1 Tax=Galdieria sulphuraria TaxID=130081 RepID=M2X9Q5_GALSU|nr:uncharacterized protein Gasu_58300 [Galdieria sulphuraria]EME26597.1 hypothetical protein Gasu_58300 [Galdieria sulphuraria]GJD07404.1 hypothetical protein Gasu2_17660 [Galdieria sulphuraria]|eukprot:XP_005703117.1 hypothetical protein Gasu_58300 [Galdieria sulphuraria]